jgi:hypothetical protein
MSGFMYQYFSVFQVDLRLCSLLEAKAWKCKQVFAIVVPLILRDVDTYRDVPYLDGVVDRTS